MDLPANLRINPDWYEQFMGLEVGTTQLEGYDNTQDNRIARIRLLGNGQIWTQHDDESREQKQRQQKDGGRRIGR